MNVVRVVCELKQNITDDEKLCAIESSVKCFARNVRETLLDRGIREVNNFLKDQKLLAVPIERQKPPSCTNFLKDQNLLAVPIDK